MGIDRARSRRHPGVWQFQIDNGADVHGLEGAISLRIWLPSAPQLSRDETEVLDPANIVERVLRTIFVWNNNFGNFTCRTGNAAGGEGNGDQHRHACTYRSDETIH